MEWQGSQKNATARLGFTIELNLSHFPNGRLLSAKTLTRKLDKFSRQMSISHEGLIDNSWIQYTGPLTQLLALRAFKEILRVPVSDGFFTVK